MGVEVQEDIFLRKFKKALLVEICRNLGYNARAIKRGTYI